MIDGKSIAVVIPSFKEETQIEGVISTMPEFVDRIIVIDDCSPAPDRTVEIVRAIEAVDPRVVLKVHDVNRGVGGAIATGYRVAYDESIDVTAVMAGDGQMDPSELLRIVLPVVRGRADYTKANRLSRASDWAQIPRTRLIGNLSLSLLTRFATGYWTLNDAQTGYTASANWLLGEFLDRGIYARYGVPNDLLLTCAFAGARVIDIPQRPVYDVGETSKLRPSKVAFPIFMLLVKGFFRRVFVQNLLVESNPIPFCYLFSFFGLVGGIIWSSSLAWRSIVGEIQPTELVPALLLLFGGVLLFVLAVILDVVLSGERARARSAIREEVEGAV